MKGRKSNNNDKTYKMIKDKQTSTFPVPRQTTNNTRTDNTYFPKKKSSTELS